MTRKRKQADVLSILQLLNVASTYLDHPDVHTAYDEQPRRLAEATHNLSSAADLLSSTYDPRSLHKSLRSEVAYSVSCAAQDVADLLDRPVVLRINFALPASNIVRALRRLVTDLKKWRS
jgi:hypothetical protein